METTLTTMMNSNENNSISNDDSVNKNIGCITKAVRKEFQNQDKSKKIGTKVRR